MNEFAIDSVVLGTYRITHVFNGGGMGVVYRARHLVWDIDLAIKHPRAEFLQSERQRQDFMNECETWSSLGLHPYLATCFYTREIDNIPCVVAEFAEGGSLNDWIASRRIYAGEDAAVVARIVQVATAMALGLEGAHRAGLIHCDMKPGNVLMTDDGMAKITDFGLAKVIAGKGGSMLEGWMSIPWASPEQIRGESLGFATDIWSWAVSVFEIFMGGIQWQSGAVVGAALEEYGERGQKAVGLPEMPQALFQLLTRCFQRNTGDRPGFSEIAEEIFAIYEDLFDEPCPAQKPDMELVAADSLNNRAVSLLDIGRNSEAESLLKQALDRDPLHPEATFNLTTIRLSRNEGDVAWATQNLRTVAKAEPGNPLPVKLLAQLCLLIGNRKEAIHYFDEAVNRAWTGVEKAEIDLLRRGEIHHVGFVLSKPRSGSDYCADFVRFQRLMDKTDRALSESRKEDAARYVQLARDMEGFGRHPRLRRAASKL